MSKEQGDRHPSEQDRFGACNHLLAWTPHLCITMAEHKGLFLKLFSVFQKMEKDQQHEKFASVSIAKSLSTTVQNTSG